MKRLENLLLLALALAFLFYLPGVVDAKPKKGAKAVEVLDKQLVPVWPSPLDPGVLDSVFRELPFGQGMEATLKILGERLEEQLKPVLKVTGNARERDVMKESVKRSVGEVRKSYEEFVGQKSAYAVSVVADEYRDGAGEGLMRYPYGANHAYFFFSGGKFWKLLLCLEGPEEMKDLVATGVEKYGPSANVFWADETKQVPLRAQWKDSTFDVSFEPADDVFTCKRLVWVYVPERERVMQVRGTGNTGGASGSSSAAEDLLKQIMMDPTPKQTPVPEPVPKKNK